MMNIEAACKSVSCGKTFAAVSFFFYSAMVNYVELCDNISCPGRKKDVLSAAGTISKAGAQKQDRFTAERTAVIRKKKI